MPGRKLVNAGCFASADLPILPFLAPRVFSQWPVSKGARRWNTAGSGGMGRGGLQRDGYSGLRRAYRTVDEKGPLSDERQIAGDASGKASTRRRPSQAQSNPAAYTRPNGSTSSSSTLQPSATQRDRAAARPFACPSPMSHPQYSQISTFIRTNFCRRYTTASSATSPAILAETTAERDAKDIRDIRQESPDSPPKQRERTLVTWAPSIHVRSSLAHVRTQLRLKHPHRSRGPRTGRTLTPKESREQRQWRSRFKPMFYPGARRERRLKLLLQSALKEERDQQAVQSDRGLEIYERNPDFARMNSLPPRFDDVWTAGMAQVRSVLPNRALLGHEVAPTPRTSGDVDINDLKKKFANPAAGGETLRHTWLGLQPGIRLYVWPRLIPWILRNCPPETACRVLMATHQEPRPPIYAMVDALEFLAKQYNQIKDERTEAGLDALLSTFHELLEGVREFRITVSQNLICRLLFVCSAEQTTKLHEALLEKDVVLNWQNCLRFAVSFGRRGDYLRGLDMLQQAIDVGADVNCGPFLETCTTILRFSIKQENGYQANTQIVSRFLEMGVKLSVHHYSSLMFNAVEAGDFSTVLRIFDLLQQNSVEPNSFIYWALLKGCIAQFNSEAASRVLRSCSHKIREFKNPYLTTNLLYCYYLQLVARSTPSLFATLVEIYRSLFSGGPLVDLGLLSAHYFAAPSPHTSTTIPPTTPALGLMILASLRHAEKPSPNATFRLYLSYRRLVKAGHAAIAPLAETDHTSNAFLLAFAQSADTLSYCPQVLKDMTIALPPAAIHVAENRPINQATPTTQTWTILLNGFMRHKQTQAAEKVLQLMRTRGAEPNVVTWNSLVAGYAGAQDVEGAVGALKRMEGEGVQMDGYTVAALGHLRDRERVVKALGAGDGGAEERVRGSVDLAEDEEEDAVESGIRDMEHEAYLAPATA